MPDESYINIWGGCSKTELQVAVHDGIFFDYGNELITVTNANDSADERRFNADLSYDNQ